MAKAYEILQKAHNILELPQHWTRGAYARDVAQQPVKVECHSALSFDLLGAMQRAAYDLGFTGYERTCSAAYALVDAAMSELHGRRYACVLDFNDSQWPNHGDVLFLLRTAIRKAEQEDV